MTKLFQNPDGANCQARAVLAYLSGHDGIEDSWSASRGCYVAEPEVDRWHNCREQGYVISMRSQDRRRQLNIAFFEHRNSDEIHAVEFELTTLNPPTIDSIPEDHPYSQNKYATSLRVSHGEAAKLAEWIFQRLTDFWNATKKSAAA